MDTAGQISILESAFLGSISTSFPGRLTDAEQANVHAYLVLAHSVLEEEIESAFEDFFDSLCAKLSDDTVPRAGLALAFAIAELTTDDQRITYKKRDIVGFVQGAGRKVLEKATSANNGLKEDNLVKLARSVGADWQAFEQELSTAIADLTAFGARRGSSSHLSPFSTKTTAIAQHLDPEDVKRWVRDAASGAAAIRTHLMSQIPAGPRRTREDERRVLRASAPKLRRSRSLRRRRP